MSIVGPEGPAGATGPTGPQGPAGTLNYYAGSVFGACPTPFSCNVRTGSGFTVRRLGTTAGSYRIFANPTTADPATSVVMSISASPATASFTVRVVNTSIDSATGKHIFDLEFRNSSGTLADTDFFFIAVQVS
jgi:hypothetical protein